jgi:hypothetical protein
MAIEAMFSTAIHRARSTKVDTGFAFERRSNSL